jgi:hypothetical protein
MNFQIFESCQDLSSLVQCYWTLESSREKTPQKNTIVPDGTMKMIFHYGETYRHYRENGDNIILPRCFVIGQLTRPYIVEPLGETGTFIVRFEPDGFLPFATFPIREMENTAIPLKQLFGEEGEEIGRKIIEASTTPQRIEIIERFLLHRLTEKKTTDAILK